MKIAILDDYQNAVSRLGCFSLLDEHDVCIFTDTPDTPDAMDILATRLQDREALILIRERTAIGEPLLARLPALKLISQTGKLGNHVDLAACNRHGVAIAEGIGSPVAPAELCWGLIMAASRHLLPYATHMQTGHWQDSGPLGLGRTLNGLTLGIWGYGKIGQRIAAFGHAFNMPVLVWGSDDSRAKAVADGYAAAANRADFFAHSDVLSLHLRLNDQTRGCVTRTDLLRMKPDALLVNTSRAELIEPGALLHALQVGNPGMAALDVYEHEPATPENEPLLQLPNVLALPHLGYVEKNSYELYFRIAFENVNAFASGQPHNIANPEVLRHPDPKDTAG
ncbi:MAG: D-2-hydroxyacid dehydrogenase family protein [Thiothrix sp.]|nr:D-2-hydroxyacid dehydrogenase family protein [Thiothrix sp.]HPE59410.1 D-2-hydroxyacid dehydrogenase family protein [Thiolinea sp.]